MPVAMRFYFASGGRMDRALRRVARGHVRTALDWLRRTRRPAAVHEVRKEIKQARAALRLVRPAAGADEVRRAMKSLRRAAGRLAAARDARVMVRAFELLAAEVAAQFPEAHRRLKKNCRRAAGRFRRSGSRPAAKRWLQKADRRLRDVNLSAAGWAAVGPGLRRSYGRARALFRLAGRQSSAEHFHQWRRPAKDLWYQLRMLRPDWPPPTRAYLDGLERLGEDLGELHDLALLEEFLAEPGAGDIARPEGLRRRIAARRKKLRAAALRLGARLFAETPASVCRRLEIQWRDGRGGAGAGQRGGG